MAFPNARFDLTEAGSCVACGMNTAAGFHLLRAAEIGLWELGKDCQIPLAKAGKIEFQQWGAIIGELGTEIMRITQWPNFHSKEDAHKFYNQLLVEIRAFNDGWRRHIAHVRKSQPPQTNDDAQALCSHFERFFRVLATKISEGNYTPILQLSGNEEMTLQGKQDAIQPRRDLSGLDTRRPRTPDEDEGEILAELSWISVGKRLERTLFVILGVVVLRKGSENCTKRWLDFIFGRKARSAFLPQGSAVCCVQCRRGDCGRRSFSP